ncbi:DNA-processing protein DprA [Fusobacterium sp. PH5-44]|uniref:DNA-processing protein DprA n=1 Tax=unclassified Fusobacterium TaxID=2648384 RepID=UPI003D1D6C21
MNWYKLRVLGIRDSVIRNLMKNIKNFSDLFKLDENHLRKYFKFEENEILQMRKLDKLNIEREIELLVKNRVRVINLTDEDYPEDLKNISQPPVFLYYRGNVKLLKGRKIAVVGTRRATSYGKMACEKITDGLVDGGVTTVSGLALGIDAICHRRTLEKKGDTIAVLGSGIDVIYPKINKKLWEDIGEKGLIITEFPLGTEPTNYNFPMRNRIIVGISRGVVVVESQESGGSLITANIVLEENRDVFAVSGDIFSPSSQGCNNLIKRSHAKLITDVQDILNEYGWSSKKEEYSLPKLSEIESKVYGELVKEKTLDELIVSTGEKTSDLLSVLMDLEIKNIVVSISGGKYRRRN